MGTSGVELEGVQAPLGFLLEGSILVNESDCASDAGWNGSAPGALLGLESQAWLALKGSISVTGCDCEIDCASDGRNGGCLQDTLHIQMRRGWEDMARETVA